MRTLTLVGSSTEDEALAFEDGGHRFAHNFVERLAAGLDESFFLLVELDGFGEAILVFAFVLLVHNFDALEQQVDVGNDLEELRVEGRRILVEGWHNFRHPTSPNAYSEIRFWMISSMLLMNTCRISLRFRSLRPTHFTPR